jgi:hypothetical protein
MNYREQKVVDNFRELRAIGGLRYQSKGPRTLSNKVANYFGAKSESQLSVDGIRIFTTKLTGLTRFSLFAKVADWGSSSINSSSELLSKFGKEDSGLNLRLNCTIRYNIPNSFGLQLMLDEEKDQLFTSHRDNPQSKSEVWSLSDLRKSWLERKGEFVIVEFQVIKEGDWETAVPSRLTYFSEPNFDFKLMLNNGYLTLDHLLSKVNLTVRERGPLFKLDRAALDRCYSVHRRHVL